MLMNCVSDWINQSFSSNQLKEHRSWNSSTSVVSVFAAAERSEPSAHDQGEHQHNRVLDDTEEERAYDSGES